MHLEKEMLTKKYTQASDNEQLADERIATQDKQDEQLMDWKLEAAAIIHDIKDHVADVHISEKLPSNECNIYLNVRTIEGATYCVCCSPIGFCLVSDTFDQINKANVQNDSNVFETIYSLLDQLSPCYVQSFGNSLCTQLTRLQHQLQQETATSDAEGADVHDRFESSQSLTYNSPLK